MLLETDLQIIPLDGLDQGHTYAIVVTNAQSAVTLQFRHAGDPTWRTHPELVNIAPVGTVVSKSVFCFTPQMRLSFASPQTGNKYYLSCTASAEATF